MPNDVNSIPEKISDLQPNPEGLVYTPYSWFELLDWQKVFVETATHRTSGCESFHAPAMSEPLMIHVDLGAGDGAFVRDRARNHLGVKFLAVERLLGRVRKISKRCVREGLSNVRVLRIEAAYAVEHLFPPASISSITILCPDPWPKRRHVKNRLIQTSFLNACGRVLKPEGWIALKTDDLNYFEQMKEALAGCSGLKAWVVDPGELLPEKTDFEKQFLAEGKPIHFIAAKRS